MLYDDQIILSEESIVIIVVVYSYKIIHLICYFSSFWMFLIKDIYTIFHENLMKYCINPT